MGRTCIITDYAAQFSSPKFPGQEFIHFLDQRVDLGDNKHTNIQNICLADLPKWTSTNTPPRIITPSHDDLFNLVTSVYQSYDDLFIILHSASINPTYSVFDKIIKNIHGRANIHLIDSRSISIGEGCIVQFAAALVAKNLPGMVIEEQLREIIPHVYTLLCTPGLSYLHKSGFIDPGQAVVGEMLALLPVFALEDGVLNPVDKMKNVRNVFEYFIEFIDEFEQIELVSFLQPAPPQFNESKTIRLHLEETYESTLYSEHPINPFLASLIGPQGFGLVVIETS